MHWGYNHKDYRRIIWIIKHSITNIVRWTGFSGQASHG